jgi:hypothetical protein
MLLSCDKSVIPTTELSENHKYMDTIQISNRMVNSVVSPQLHSGNHIKCIDYKVGLPGKLEAPKVKRQRADTTDGSSS